MAILQFGAMLKRRREELGLSQEELAEGICAVATLSRLENGGRLPKKENLELLLQRIGYSDLMVDIWADEQEFQLHRLKFHIRQAVIMQEMDQARALLEEFEKAAPFQSKPHQQFLILHQTLLYGDRYSNAEQLSRLEHALKLTCPKYNPNSFPRVLSYEEIILVNTIAVRYARGGDRRKAIQLLFQLKAYYEKNAVSIEETLRTEPMILYNLSKYLGLERRYDECIEICDLGIQLAQRTGRCSCLPETLYNRAWALEKRNLPQDRANAKLYVQQALQMAQIMKQNDCVQYCQKFLLEHFPENESL